jgi:large subunit ribosomal protein L18
MKQLGRSRRHKRVFKKVKGSQERPRLLVFRSKKHIYAQLVDDSNQRVITGCSTLSQGFGAKVKSLAKDDEKVKTSDKDAAKILGLLIAEKALEKGVKSVSFDRAGYAYHGRVKNLADGAREGGLLF